MSKLAVPFLIALAAVPAQASISVTTSGTPGITSISLALQQDVSMTVTNGSTSNNFVLFVMRNVHASPSAQTAIQAVNLTSNLSFSVNGLGNYTMGGWVDEGFSGGDIDPNDSYLFWRSTFALEVGDVVTLRAGTVSASAASSENFNLLASGTYEMFLYNSFAGAGGTLMSTAATPVPEPSTYGLILGGLALAGAALRRRKSLT